MTIFTDNFTRADSTNLGASWVEVTGDWSIVSNQLSPGAAGGTIILRAAGAMASNDHSAQVTIAATTAASQGVWCRGDAAITNGYLWRNNGASWDLFSVIGGSFTVIGTYTAAAAPGDVAKVQAVGSTIKAFVNGVERVSVVNSGVAAGTSVGIRSDSASGLRYDDFTAADAASGVVGSAAGVFGGLTGTASGTRKVVGTAALAGGALAGSAAGLRTVIGAASATFGGLVGHATLPSDVTGSALGAFGGLQGTAVVPGPEPAVTGSWYGLLDILREGAQLYREEQQRDPVACPDCGEPLRSGPRSELYCPFDGQIWGAGGRRIGHVSTRN